MSITSTKVESFKKDFFKLVENSNNILIGSHLNPDDDSIGSVLALLKYLEQKFPNKKITIAYEGDVYAPRYGGFFGFGKIVPQADFKNLVPKMDLLVILDADDLWRLTKTPEVFTDIKTVKIDHHVISGDTKFDLELVNDKASSTVEILYETFFKDDDKLDPELCRLLLLGVLGDTGFLNFVNANNCGVLNIVSRLIKDGNLDMESFKAGYTRFSEEVVDLMTELHKNAKVMEVAGWPKFTYTYIPDELTQKYSYPDIRTATADFALTQLKRVNGVNWGVILYPRKEDTALSSRSSRLGPNVREISVAMGVGSGHDLAAGGYFKGKTVEEAREILFDWLKNNKPVLFN